MSYRQATHVAMTSLLLTSLALSANAAEEARDVTLRMKGGGFQVTGEVRSFDGTKYVIETSQFGRMTLQAARFECVGNACNTIVTQAGWVQEALTAERHETLTIRGSDNSAEVVVPALIRGYATGAGLTVVNVISTDPAKRQLRLMDRRGKNVATIDFARAEPAKAFEAIEQSAAAIAMTERPATREELESLAAAGPKSKLGVNEHALGTDGLAIVVSPEHQASSLPSDALARVFSGQVSDWYELGFPQGKIRVVLREGADDGLERLHNVFLKPRNLKLGTDIERLSRDSEVADAVARDKNAIGLVAFSAIRNAKPLNIETACGIIQRPSVFAVRAGEYPLSRRLYLHALAPPKQAVARELLRYATSADAQSVLSDAMIASQHVEQLSLADQPERMAYALNAQGEAFDLAHMRMLLADLKSARRLSTTLRYAPGSVDLDQTAKTELPRLASLLMSPEYAGKRILLAGFVDTNGAKFQANLTSTAKRAGQVRAALLNASNQKIDHKLLLSKGYGPLAPLACNDTPEGARLNRRIEVWIKD